MAREQYITTVICPKCGKRGEAEWSEAANPIFQGFARMLEKLSDGFKRGRTTEGPGYDEIICSTCNIVVNKR